MRSPSSAQRAILAALALAWFTGVLSAQAITEFEVPDATSSPRGIAAGPDSNLWFAEYLGQGVTRITPTGGLTKFTIPGYISGPMGVAAGPDGNVWFTEFLQNNVARITPAGVITEFPLPCADPPLCLSSSGALGIVAGPDGNLWIAEALGKIGRATTAGVVTDFDVPTSTGKPEGIAAGADGNLWFTESFGNQIGRITTSGSVTEFPIPTFNSTPTGIAAGPDGNIWFTEFAGNKIGRITPAGVLTEFPITQPALPMAIAVGPDGNLWFVGVSEQLGRITLAGVATAFDLPHFSGFPGQGLGIALGPDGSLWITRANEYEARITRFTLTSCPGGCPTPTLSSLSPTSGTAAGAPLDLMGTNFVPGISVTVGGLVAPILSLTDSTQVTVETAALAPGTLNDVSVVNPGTASATLPKAWFADFSDVAQGNPFHLFVEKLIRDGVTGGCGAGDYCPGASATRAQMAVFLLRSHDGPTYLPPACVSAPFADVPCSNPFASWIQELVHRQITAGCGGGDYCPNSPVTREEMAVLLLLTEQGAGYLPPPATGLFADVPVSSPYARWIEELSRRGVTAGCGSGDFCPQAPTTRAQMAAFLVATFGLS